MTDIEQQLIDRVKLGISRKQVAFGRDMLVNMGRRKQLAMVWITEDLARNATFKLIRECENLELPLVIWGESESIGELTGEPSVKVYLIKKNFSGLKTLLHDLKEADMFIYT